MENELFFENQIDKVAQIAVVDKVRTVKMKILLFALLLSSIEFAEGKINKEDFLVDPEKLTWVNEDEYKGGTLQMFAGHLSTMFDDLKTKDKDKYPSDFGYFFWKFQDKKLHDKINNYDNNDDFKLPLIFWLNGGPGCSSMDGALVESGPIRINDQGMAFLNNGSWISRGDLIFVDQPMGTGFSSLKNNIFYEDDLIDVSNRFLEFLQKYFELFPEEIERDIILAGESYAGQYIPYFAKSILDRNKNITTSSNNITSNANNPSDNVYNLRNLLIGNGWIDPTTQSLSYLPFAMENNFVDRSLPSFKELLHVHELCQKKINSVLAEQDAPFEYSECNDIINELLAITRTKSSNLGESCINVYNYELRDSYPSCGMNWPIDVSNVGKFFQRKNVRDALHINPVWSTSWQECRSTIGDNLKNAGLKPSISLFPELLENGLEIVLFNGDKDLICNNKGILDMIDNMKWGGSKGFTDDVQEYDWFYRDFEHDDEAAGFVQYDKNLTFISVFNASHMVPHDKSDISRGIVDISLDYVLLEEHNKRDILVSGSIPYDGFSSSLSNDEIDEGVDDDVEENEEKNQKHGEDDEDGKEDNSDNETSDEEEEDDNDEEHDEIRSLHAFIAFLSVCSIAISTFFIIKYKDTIKPKLKSIFGPNSYIKLGNTSKTVTWADHLENPTPLEEEYELSNASLEDEAEDEFNEEFGQSRV